MAESRYEDLDTETQIQFIKKDYILPEFAPVESYDILDHPSMSIARSSFFELYQEVLQDLDAQELKKNETHLARRNPNPKRIRGRNLQKVAGIFRNFRIGIF